ncbi:Transmembrane amino acid transporter protein [Seminavis robusta]|uniref:Transmembrane amino acid transporter protein n=1 Tax=Seminavis robusta TaxID=568900 RepID=A0A9N8H7B4_9STRA|nr:Transmembrane amino acid transporter protein [Seminavis robusta]|eukprot:Sro173_g076380.1 Transmembrane amino acid transporter protein (418) ;mRNA; f:63237-64658
MLVSGVACHIILAALNCIASTIGVGILNMPSAVAQVGLVPGTVIFLFGILGSLLTGLQLYELTEVYVFLPLRDNGTQRSIEEAVATNDPEADRLLESRRQDTPQAPVTRIPYLQIAFKLFGQPGMVIVLVAMVCTAIGANCVCLIAVADNLENIWEEWSKRAVILAATFLGICLVWTPIHEFKPEDGPPPTPQLTFATLVKTFGSILFSFAGHTGYPTYHAQMREDHQHFKASLLGTYEYMGIMLIPFAFVTPHLWGTAVADNLLSSLPPNSTVYAINILITIHIFFAISPWVMPLSDLLNFVVFHHFQAPNLEHHQYIFPICVQAVACLVAIAFADSFAVVMSFMGATFMACLTFVFPSILYMTHLRNKGGYTTDPWGFACHGLASFLIVAGGVLALVFTLYFTAVDMLNTKAGGD